MPRRHGGGERIPAVKATLCVPNGDTHKLLECMTCLITLTIFNIVLGGCAFILSSHGEITESDDMDQVDLANLERRRREARNRIHEGPREPANPAPVCALCVSPMVGGCRTMRIRLRQGLTGWRMRYFGYLILLLTKTRSRQSYRYLKTPVSQSRYTPACAVDKRKK